VLVSGDPRFLTPFVSIHLFLFTAAVVAALVGINWLCSKYHNPALHTAMTRAGMVTSAPDWVSLGSAFQYSVGFHGALKITLLHDCVNHLSQGGRYWRLGDMSWTKAGQAGSQPQQRHCSHRPRRSPVSLIVPRL
jgi:hypothetical protein